jgi:aminopeptidase
MKTYVPSKKILEKYAEVMVNYALNNGKGLKKGEIVMLDGNDSCKPLYAAVYKKILEEGGHVVENYSLDDSAFSSKKYFFENATKQQATFFPEKYYQGLIDTIDHRLYIHAEGDLNLLKHANSKIMMMHKESLKPWTRMRFEKENKGNFTWTICNYGTQSMADAAGLTLKEYWAEIIKACYLREKNPVTIWKQLQKDIQKNVKKLNMLQIREIHMLGKDMDLKLRLPKKGAWKGGSGSNIPSFEIFTSPDWRGTNGWIRFNQPLYYFGNIITDIYL